MTNTFCFGVANAYLYDVSNGDILAQSKTLLDSSIAVALSNVDVRGGWGNPLLASYFHSAGINITLNDAQWNLAFLAKNVGASLVTGKNIYGEETVTLGGGGAGTITGTPLAVVGSTVYGWVTLASGLTEKVEFTGSNFTCTGAEGDDVVVRYYYLDAAARSATVSANFVPSIARLVLEAQLFSSDQSANVIGTIQFEFPRVTLSGNLQISLKGDSVASTPLEARALAFTPSGSTTQIYGYFSEKLTAANWYDNLIAISAVGGDFSVAAAATHTIVVRGIHSDGSVSLPPVADLTFSSSDALKATVGAHTGVVTGVAAGSTVIHIYPTNKDTIDAYVTATVPA
jgi:hypothetical protein